MEQHETNQLPEEIRALLDSLKQATTGAVLIQINHPNEAVGRLIFEKLRPACDKIFTDREVSQHGPWQVDIDWNPKKEKKNE